METDNINVLLGTIEKCSTNVVPNTVVLKEKPSQNPSERAA